MESLFLLLIFSILIVLTSLVGGILPFLHTWGSNSLHLMTAFSAGVFVGQRS